MHPSVRSSLVLSLAWLAACGGSDKDDTDTDDGGSIGGELYDVLVDTVILPAGDATCPAGGVTLRTGYDDGDEGGTSEDGLLQDGEVDATTTICNGQSGTLGEPGGTLLRYEPVEPGEEGCDDGGVSIFVGADANTDGQLQDTEIANTTVVCADEDPFNVIPSPDAPGGAAGSATIDLHGGSASGAADDGGDGGEVLLYMFQPGNAFLRAHTTGEVDSSFTVPAVNHDFGSNKLTISSDTTIMMGSTGSISATYPDGTLFMANSRLYERDSGQNLQVTGLEVASGATLTLDGDTIQSAPVAIIVPAPGSTTTFNLNFSDSVLIEGDVEFDDAWLGSRLYLYGDLIEVDGTIDASAPNGGGDIYLYATNSPTLGTVVVTGTLRANGTGGSEGGSVQVYAARNTFIDGTLSADASNSTSGQGPQGGYVYITTYGGPSHVGGSISVEGGNAGGVGFFDSGEGNVFDSSGDGGAAGIVNVAGGKVVFSADVDGQGGNASANCGDNTACDGGEGGAVLLQGSEFGGIAATGTWDLDGADGVENGDGGDGGEGTLVIRSGSGGLTVTQRYAGGDAQFGATLSAVGGDAGQSTSGTSGDGGDGGALVVEAQYSANPNAEVQLLGVASIDIDGGDGFDDAGNGGSVYAYYQAYGVSGSIFDRSGSLDAAFPTGITFDVPVSGVGGEAEEDDGGEGGMFFAYTETSSDRRRDVWLSADLDLDGADADHYATSGGVVRVFSPAGDIEVSGAIGLDGGNATDSGEGWGGNGGWAQFTTLAGTVDLSADIDASGGDGATAGGEGGLFSAEGALVTWSGTCTLDGADGTGTNAWGGDGGEGTINSTAGSSDNSGTFSVDGGSGAGTGEDGEDGTFAVDGLPQ